MKMNRFLKMTVIRSMAILLTMQSMLYESSYITYADNDIDPVIMVSLGDSYSSGEGIEDFYGQNDDISEKVRNSDWIAHRSTRAWPGMLKLPGLDGTMAKHKDENWFFVAASGAKTEHLQNSYKRKYDKLGLEGTHELEPQLDVFDRINDIYGVDTVDYVTLTFGGNDVGFKDIILTAGLESSYLHNSLFYSFGGYLVPSLLSDRLTCTWKRFYEDNGIRDNIKNAYIDIAEKAGSNANIIVAGYPKLIGAHGEGICFSVEEAYMINENVKRFNQALNEIVESCKKSEMKIHFVSVEEAFNGREPGTINPFISDVIWFESKENEDINEKDIVSSYSMHPNYDGAVAYASCVQNKIKEIEDLKTGEVSELHNDANGDEYHEMNYISKLLSSYAMSPEDVIYLRTAAFETDDFSKYARSNEPVYEILERIAFVLQMKFCQFENKYLGISSTFDWKNLCYGYGLTGVEVLKCEYVDNDGVEKNINSLFEDFQKGVMLNVTYKYVEHEKEYIEDEIYKLKWYPLVGWRIEHDWNVELNAIKNAF